MMPIGEEPTRSWRIVEVKSSTSVKDYYRDDIAIQAFVAQAAGVPLNSIALAHINSDWLYPGNEQYQGLLIENDLTNEAFERADEVRDWIAIAQGVVGDARFGSIATRCSSPDRTRSPQWPESRPDSNTLTPRRPMLLVLCNRGV
jgi:hypothetical protein